MSNSTQGSVPPLTNSAVDRYFDVGPYETIINAKSNFMTLALERACGMISERAFNISVLMVAGQTGFPSEDAMQWAEYAFETLRTKCPVPTRVPESVAPSLEINNDR